MEFFFEQTNLYLNDSITGAELNQFVNDMVDGELMIGSKITTIFVTRF